MERRLYEPSRPSKATVLIVYKCSFIITKELFESLLLIVYSLPISILNTLSRSRQNDSSGALPATALAHVQAASRQTCVESPSRAAASEATALVRPSAATPSSACAVRKQAPGQSATLPREMPREKNGANSNVPDGERQQLRRFSTPTNSKRGRFRGEEEVNRRLQSSTTQIPTSSNCYRETRCYFSNFLHGYTNLLYHEQNLAFTLDDGRRHRRNEASPGFSPALDQDVGSSGFVPAAPPNHTSALSPAATNGTPAAAWRPPATRRGKTQRPGGLLHSPKRPRLGVSVPRRRLPAPCGDFRHGSWRRGGMPAPDATPACSPTEAR